MKKTFSLERPGTARPRVIEAVKHDVRRYVQREHRKPLPEGFTRWTFACQAGADEASARPCELDNLGRVIDEVASTGAGRVYVEIAAVPGHRNQPGKTTPARSS